MDEDAPLLFVEKAEEPVVCVERGRKHARGLVTVAGVAMIIGASAIIHASRSRGTSEMLFGEPNGGKGTSADDDDSMPSGPEYLDFEVHNAYTKSTGMPIGSGYPWLDPYRMAEPNRETTVEAIGSLLESSKYELDYRWSISGTDEDFLLTTNSSKMAALMFYTVRGVVHVCLLFRARSCDCPPESVATPTDKCVHRHARSLCDRAGPFRFGGRLDHGRAH